MELLLISDDIVEIEYTFDELLEILLRIHLLNLIHGRRIEVIY